MPCSFTCLLATVFIISMIVFENAVQSNNVVQQYRAQLPSKLQILYDKIAAERSRIYYYGYILGFILSLVVIINNYYGGLNRYKLTNSSLVCLVVVISFTVNYFYYILSPKTDWMLNHIHSPEQTKAWLTMYREMQKYYHIGLVFGIVAVGLFAFAFRC